MCLVLFAYRMHETYKLIAAANRDEFYDRPTAPAGYWEDHPRVLAGRDLSKGGTWMGISETGRFAALTNYRNPRETTLGTRSRGELAADFLKGSHTPAEYMQEAAEKRLLYPGYNLLTGDENDLYYYSNVQNQVKKLEPGIYGLSNDFLDTDWPKVTRGKAGLSAIIRENDAALPERLFSLLQQADPAPDESLPKTGLSLEWERLLSPLFIKSTGYGTRSSTVLLMTEHKMDYRERVFSEEEREDRQFTIAL
jgi:uncharacterized protein with NRDE domain